MRKTKVYCDRCAKEIVYKAVVGEPVHKNLIKGFVIPQKKHSWDLCSKCETALNKFMKR